MIHSASAEVHNTIEDAGAEVCSAAEGIVQRYAVQQKAQCGGTQCSRRHNVKVRSVAVGAGAEVCSAQTDQVRSCAGQTKKNCGYSQVSIGEVADIS